MWQSEELLKACANNVTASIWFLATNETNHGIATNLLEYLGTSIENVDDDFEYHKHTSSNTGRQAGTHRINRNFLQFEYDMVPADVP